MTDDVVAFVFARAGSKGLPRKNLLEVGGLPLVAHSVRAAQESRLIDRVIVSTDSLEIARVAEDHGALVPDLRPAELAGDNTPEWAVWQFEVHRELERCGGPENFGVFVSLPPTSPLRSPLDVDECITRLAEDDADIVVTVRSAERNPWFNMVRLAEDGHAELLGTDLGITRRQDAPEVFDLTTVAYVTTPSFILSAEGVFDGVVSAVVVPKSRAIDIDDEVDLKIARCIYRKSPDTGA